MLPIGLLMKEHRVIEKMIEIIKQELENIKEEGEVNDVFIDAAVDFFRTYADRTHHGKEENILFKEVEDKNISPEHKNTMDSLIDDHVFGREVVTHLKQAKEDYTAGKEGAIDDIIDNIKKLLDLYPSHIDTEDNHFFKPIMEYFSESQLHKMIEEFYEFDRNMIHEKYNNFIEEWTDRL